MSHGGIFAYGIFTDFSRRACFVYIAVYAAYDTYLEIGQASEDLVYLTETEKAVLAFCADKKPARGEFNIVKGQNRNIVLAVYASDESWSEKFEYVLYVDINSIVSYVKWLNWMFCGAVVIVGAVICAIGLKLGKTTESAQEIRQSFF